jgi:hypothetical protein
MMLHDANMLSGWLVRILPGLPVKIIVVDGVYDAKQRCATIVSRGAAPSVPAH